MLHTTPRLVISAPPIDVISPPEMADVEVMFATVFVVRTGRSTVVGTFNRFCMPYAVPAALVA